MIYCCNIRILGTLQQTVTRYLIWKYDIFLIIKSNYIYLEHLFGKLLDTSLKTKRLLNNTRTLILKHVFIDFAALNERVKYASFSIYNICTLYTVQLGNFSSEWDLVLRRVVYW